MPTLNDGIKQMKKIGDIKGWGEDVATKIYYGMIELAEAGDAWKHRDDPNYLLQELGITRDELELYMAEEFIDTIKYCLHGLHCIGISEADEMFDYKMEKNLARNRIYADDKK